MANSKNFSPRLGDTLQVLGIARISTDKQDEKSLADQEALLRNWLIQNAGHKFELQMISGTGSGERLDREESSQATKAVESSRYDLVIMEDLGRASRRIHALLFCELCEDHRTRVIALNDSIDTSEENWRVMAGFASMRHEMYNKDTASRIKRTLKNRFVQGGVIGSLIYGYEKPPGTKSDSELKIIPEAKEVYDRIFRQLEDGATYIEVADKLNRASVQTGPYSRLKRWSAALVKKTVFNPILIGIRVRNGKVCYRDNSTGRRKTRPGRADERTERYCPHLQIIDKERWLRVTSLLSARTESYRTSMKQHVDENGNRRFKKRTTWPGRHAICGVCGRLTYWNACGEKESIYCSGVKAYRCWNSLICKGKKLAEQLIDRLHEEIESLPDYDQALVGSIREKYNSFLVEKNKKLKDFDRRITENQGHIHRVTDAISQVGLSESLKLKLSELEQIQANLLLEKRKLDSLAEKSPDLPPLKELKTRARAALKNLDFDDPEFGRLMKRLMPNIVLLPYMLAEQKKKVLRCHVTINLTGIIGEMPAEVFGLLVEKNVTIDVFDPPITNCKMTKMLEGLSKGKRLEQIAKNLKISINTANFALILKKYYESHRLMDPFELVKVPFENLGRRNRRHEHFQFRFEPLQGFPVWTQANRNL
ncbi:MAG: recombinase family protein [Gemmataceae bacterium]